MRRLFVLALGSALIVSACGTSSFWPGASSGASAAAPSGSQTPISTPEPVSTPTPAKTKAQPTPTAKVSVAPTGDTADWTTVAPAGAGFTVLMPGEPTLSTPTSSGYTTSMWTYADGLDLAYFVGELKYSKGTLTSQKLATAYANGLAGMEKASGVKVTAQGDVTVNGHLGRSFTAGSTAMTLQGFLFIIGDNLYMVYAAWAPTITDSKVDAFLASFHFTN